MLKPKNLHLELYGKNLFKGERVVFVTGAAPKTKESTEIPQETEKKKTITQEQVEKNLSVPDRGVLMLSTLDNTLKILAKKACPESQYFTAKNQQSYYLKLRTAFIEGLKKIQPDADETAFWQSIKTKGQRITIENDYFVILDAQNNEVDLDTTKEGLDRISATGIRIDQEDIGVRETDQTALQAEDEQSKKVAAGDESRKKHVDTGLRTGKLKFEGKADIEKTKIDDVFPDAKNGDRVDIRRGGVGAPRTAIKENGVWIWEKPLGKNDKVKINPNDTVSYTPYTAALKSEKPEAPKINGEIIGPLGYMKLTNKASWQEIAKTFMCMKDTPIEGIEYKKLEEPEKGATIGSPQYVLNQQGYFANNPEDVAEYAKLLKTVDDNNPNKLYVWIVRPKNESSRSLKEKVAKNKADKENQAIESSKKVVTKETKEDYKVLKRHFDRLLGIRDQDADYELPENIHDIVNSDKLWNQYWKDDFKGKGLIERGFASWGIDKTEIRTKLLHAITGDGIFNSNKRVSFEDIMEEFQIFKNMDGKPSHSLEEFTLELKFQEIGLKVASNPPNDPYKGLPQQDAEWYQQKAEKYNEKNTEYNKKTEEEKAKLPPNSFGALRGERYQYYINIMKGASFIMEGLSTMTLRVPVETMEAKIEQDEQAKKQAKDRRETEHRERDDLEPNTTEYERYFLQLLFHPGNTMAMEDMLGQKETTGDKDKKTITEAYIYEIIESSTTKVAGKIDQKQLLDELNDYVLRAVLKYLRVKNEDPAKAAELEVRYGFQGNPSKATSVNELMNLVKVKDIENYFYGQGAERKANRGILDHLRNMVTDGFIEKEHTSDGTQEAAPEFKGWRDLNSLKDSKDAKEQRTAKNVEQWKLLNEQLQNADPLTGTVLRNYYSMYPDRFAKKSKDEIQKQVDGVNDTIKVAQKEIIAINVGVSNPGKESGKGVDVRIGAGKTFDLGDGYTFGVGVGHSVITLQPYIGVYFGKHIDVTENLKVDLNLLGAGVEPFRARFFAGQGIDFSLVQPVSDNYDIVPGVGGGYGATVGANPAEWAVGPYAQAGLGIKRDNQRVFDNKLRAKKEEKGYTMVESAQDTAAKAEAIRHLPKIGPLLFEMEKNFHWNEDQLIDFYKNYLLPGLEEVAAMETIDDNKGSLSEIGVQGTLSAGIALEAALVGGTFLFGSAIGTPALGAAMAASVVAGFHLKVGIGVGGKVLINVSQSRSTGQMSEAAQKDLVARLEKAYPGAKFSLEADTIDTKEAIYSRNFSGKGEMLKMHGNEVGAEPKEVKAESFDVKAQKEFKAKQDEFARHHMILGEEEISPGVKMYTLVPTEVQAYQIFIDPNMKPLANGKNNGLIVNKDGKIFIASSENLDNLHIRRFDAIYAGAVNGANKHTIITISDNPEQKIDTIAHGSDVMIAREYNSEKSAAGRPRLNWSPFRSSNAEISEHTQFNCNTWENILINQTQDLFLNAADPSAERLQSKIEAGKLKRDLGLTKQMLDTFSKFDVQATIDNVKPTPADYLKQDDKGYRVKTTTPHNDKLDPYALEKDIREKVKNADGKDLSDEQIQLFAERVLQISMQEYKGQRTEKEIVEDRLKWAEEKIFPQFFEERLAALRKEDPNSVPEGVTAKTLSINYASGIRNYLQANPEKLETGESIWVAVGKGGIEGFRAIFRQTGKTEENNSVKIGYDYSRVLTSSDPRFAEQKVIARILFEENNKIPEAGHNKEFLNSRLAVKLLTLGNDQKPNPLIKLLDQDEETSKEYFKKIIEAREKIKAGEAVNIESKEYAEPIQKLRDLCHVVKDSQLGVQGSPLKLKDGFETRVIYLNGYYLMVQTTRLASGIYDFCKNPAAVYNEDILVVPQQPGQKLEDIGTVMSTVQSLGAYAQVVAAKTNSAGLNATYSAVLPKDRPQMHQRKERVGEGGVVDEYKDKTPKIPHLNIEFPDKTPPAAGPGGSDTQAVSNNPSASTIQPGSHSDE